MPTCRLVTLGCKVNQYETQYVKEALENHGYQEAEEDETADLCIVNTCTVTTEGDAKSRTAVRRLHQRHPGAAIVVMGCYATRDPDAVARLPGVTRVITDKTRLAEELRPFGVTLMPRGIRRFDGHQRAFVKVQDGCLLNCTFCIIPQVRPSLRSRAPEALIEEVAGLVGSGVQEIVLTGIHLGHYGIDLCKGKPKSRWCRLWHLLDKLAALAGDFRIRLSSLEAAEARDDLVRRLADLPRLVPHLHLCLQSGSDRVLARMKRRYRSASFLQRCWRIKQALDQPAFTTDVIVGFPGESEADFAQTCRVLREVGFCKIHVFPYSPRTGTPAAEFPEQVHPSVLHDRRQRLAELERELAQAYCRSLVGRHLDVMVEGEDPLRPGHSRGTSCRYAPVSFPGHAAALVGKRVRVRADQAADGLLVGEPVADPFQNVARVRANRRLTKRIELPLVVRAAKEGTPMERPFNQIAFERQGDVYCVRLLQTQLDDNGLEELSAEIARLIDEDGCRKMVMSLGPEDTLCLYSVFLAKLINLQRRLTNAGGALALSGLSTNTQHVFQVVGLEKFFQFYPDQAKAVEALRSGK
jgi:threonylcarbamoyladenosine tRNA methylthiotransferase MtaB